MESDLDQQRRDRLYKWTMLAMLAVTYFLMHGARQVFNASLPQIKVDLASHGATDAQLGLSRTYFLFAYGCMVPFAGIAADFFRRKWVIVIGTLLFSTSVFFTGFADSMLMFFVMYGFMNGIGQCMIPGAASSLIAQYHTETRSTALSIYQSALYVGILVSSVLAGWLGGASSSGWRISFWIFGGVAIVWLFILAAFLRNTPALKVHDEEVKPRFADAFKAFAAKPSAWLLTFAFGMLVFGSNCFRTWMPAFMQKANWGLTPASAAFHSVFWFYLGSFIGIAIGARTSDKLSPRRRGIRLTIMAIGLALSAPTMAGMVLVPTLWLSCVMMFFFGLGGGFFDCNLYAGLFDVVAPRYRSAAMGLYLSGAFFIGCPATAVLGWVGHNYSLQTGMALFGGTYALGALAIFAARLFFFKRDHVED
ncbi:MAG: MFS transporter [Kiritimatiellae bacterium]|nr:MFS transporter [Kiritimatiellia bacterium]